MVREPLERIEQLMKPERVLALLIIIAVFGVLGWYLGWFHHTTVAISR
jgi:hypothetical protein